VLGGDDELGDETGARGGGWGASSAGDVVIADRSRYQPRKVSPAAVADGGGGVLGGADLADLADHASAGELAALAARLRWEQSAPAAGAGARPHDTAAPASVVHAGGPTREPTPETPDATMRVATPAPAPAGDLAAPLVDDPAVAAALEATERARARLQGFVVRLRVDCATAGADPSTAVATVRGIVERATGAVTGAVRGEEASRVCRIRPANSTLMRNTGASPAVPDLLRALGWRPSPASVAASGGGGGEPAGEWLVLDPARADVGLLWLALEVITAAA
jgi:hypothetical protein